MMQKEGKGVNTLIANENENGTNAFEQIIVIKVCWHLLAPVYIAYNIHFAFAVAGYSPVTRARQGNKH